jgi:hypothetical protein
LELGAGGAVETEVFFVGGFGGGFGVGEEGLGDALAGDGAADSEAVEEGGFVMGDVGPVGGVLPLEEHGTYGVFIEEGEVELAGLDVGEELFGGDVLGFPEGLVDGDEPAGGFGEDVDGGGEVGGGGAEDGGLRVHQG